MVRTFFLKQKLAFLAVMALATLVLILPACSGKQGPGLLIDDPAPDFKLENLERQTVSLGQFAGKTIFINFWATTCSPCVAEMPAIQEFYRDWTIPRDVVVLAINNGENAAAVKKFIQGRGYSFPVLLDNGAYVSQKYLVRYIPTSLIVDRRGLLRFRVVGPFRDKNAIIQAVEGYLD